MLVSNYPSSIYWKYYPFPIKLLWLLCNILTDHKCKVLFLDSQVCPLICVFPYANTGFRKGRETRDQIANIRWINIRGSSKKQDSSRKTSTSALLTMPKPFDCVDHNTLWKILKEIGIPDNLTCLLRNLYADQEATVRTGHGTADWFQIGKGVCQGCILSPCLFNLYAEYIMQIVKLDEAKAGIKIDGKYQ